MRRRGWLRPRRIGCLLVVLMIAVTWLVGRAVDGVHALFRPPAISGNPLESVAPARPTSSGSPTIDRVTQRGRLIVAIQEVPGLAQRSSGSSTYTGFEIALLDLIAHGLGVDPARTNFKPLPASVREAALDRGEADLLLGGYEIPPTQSSIVRTAGPYLVRPLQVAVPVSSPVSDLRSLGQREVCAPAGSSAATALAARGVTLQTRATLASCADLLGGRIGAVAGDQAAMTALLSRTPRTLRMLSEPLGTTQYGVGLPPGDLVLHDRITAVLRRAIEDGTWAQLYAEYVGSPVPSPPELR